MNKINIEKLLEFVEFTDSKIATRKASLNAVRNDDVSSLSSSGYSAPSEDIEYENLDNSSTTPLIQTVSDDRNANNEGQVAGVDDNSDNVLNGGFKSKELENIHNYISKLSNKKGRRSSNIILHILLSNMALYTLFGALFLSIPLIYIGSKSASASMAPDPTLMIVGFVVLAASIAALLFVLCKRRDAVKTNRDELIKNLELFVLEEVRDIISKNIGKDFTDIDNDSKERLIIASFLYGTVYELCRDFNILGVDDINGPYTAPGGFKKEYNGLNRRVQYLVSMIDFAKNELSDDSHRKKDGFVDRNTKFFTCSLFFIADNYRDQFNQDVFNNINGETTGIKFGKNGQPEEEVTAEYVLKSVQSVLRGVPVLGRLI
jgi:uncharacterized protein YbcI